MILVDIAARTDLGRSRDDNEDQILVADLAEEDGAQQVPTSNLDRRIESERGPLLLVCDGMGGAVGGKEASSLAASVIHREMSRAAATGNRAVMARTLRRAIRVANQEIFAKAKAEKKLKGMGTTVSAVALAKNTAVVAQVGDSRAYVLRGNSLTQVTRDQSVVSAMINAGTISKDQAKYSMQRGRILQALGATDDIEVSLSIARLRAGDRILVCSDGLYDALDHGLVAATCGTPDLRVAADELVRLANDHGGFDNVSVIIAEVSGDALKAPTPGMDELHFIELDPHSAEGDDLTTTSLVQRRLAKQAGLRKDAKPPLMPATAQHRAIPEQQDVSTAEQRVEAEGKVGRWAYVLVMLVAGLTLFLLLQIWV